MENSELPETRGKLLRTKLAAAEWTELERRADRAQTNLSEYTRRRIFGLQSQTWEELERRAQSTARSLDDYVRELLELERSRSELPRIGSSG